MNLTEYITYPLLKMHFVTMKYMSSHEIDGSSSTSTKYRMISKSQSGVDLLGKSRSTLTFYCFFIFVQAAPETKSPLLLLPLLLPHTARSIPRLRLQFTSSTPNTLPDCIPTDLHRPTTLITVPV